MEQLLITVEDVKNELDLSIADELGLQPKQVNRWIMRQQQTILNHIASNSNGSAGLEALLADENNVKVVRAALIEQIDYVADNNFVQPNNVMNVDGQQVVEPAIAPLAHQMLLNAGLLREAE